MWSTVKIRWTRVLQKAIVPVSRPRPYSIIILSMRFIPKASLRASFRITASSYILERHLWVINSKLFALAPTWSLACKQTDCITAGMLKLLGGGGEGCHLRVVPPGQLLRSPSTPKPFIEPGFSILLTWSFFVFAFRLFRVFHWGCYVYFRIVFSSNSLCILYIFIFIYFIYFFIVLMVPYSVLTDYDRSVVLTHDDPQLWGHCRSTHNL